MKQNLLFINFCVIPMLSYSNDLCVKLYLWGHRVWILCEYYIVVAKRFI